MNTEDKICVRQVIVGAAAHDAITNIALELASDLECLANCEIFSWFEPDSSVSHRITQLASANSGSPGDILVYHLSYGIPGLTDWLLGRSEKMVIWYHNVTPASYFDSVAPEFAEGLTHGRLEIDILRERAVLAVADSAFNAQELADHDYQNVLVASPNLSIRRLDQVGADSGILSRVWSDFPEGFLLVVSQLLPHKRADHAVCIAHLLRKYLALDVGIVWAGPARLPTYRDAVEEFQRRLNEPGFLILDVVSESELAALYRACICFVSFSEHEGLSLPPLEAMANCAPVVVRGSGAIPETVGNGALIVPPEVGLLEFAEILASVIQSANVRSELRLRGQHRLSAYGERSRYVEVVEKIVSIAS